MSEDLNAKLDAMDANAVAIASRFLEFMETRISSAPLNDPADLNDIATRMQSAGVALKALADGLESVRAVTEKMRIDASQRAR